MAAAEGFRRIRLIGKTILVIGLILLAADLVGFIIDVVFHTGPNALGVAPVGIFLSALGAAILLAAWVAEGFCEPRRPPHD
jgi:hypothetical protein